MLWFLRAIMLVGYAGAATLLVLGAADLAARRHKRAIGELVSGLAGFCAGVLLMGAGAEMIAGSALGAQATAVEHARLVGQLIASEMTWSAVGFALGVGGGAFLAARRRRREQSEL